MSIKNDRAVNLVLYHFRQSVSHASDKFGIDPHALECAFRIFYDRRHWSELDLSCWLRKDFQTLDSELTAQAIRRLNGDLTRIIGAVSTSHKISRAVLTDAVKRHRRNLPPLSRAGQPKGDVNHD